MKINYIIGRNGKLFSFHRHHFNSDGENFIDGGFDYTRTNTNVFSDEVSNLISDIREQLEFSYIGKNNIITTKFLKDINTKVLNNFIKKHQDSERIFYKFRVEAFTYELKYRKQKTPSPIKVKGLEEGS